MTSTEAIKIVAEPLDAERCRFRVDRPLLPERWAYFDGREAAADAPLADAILAVPGAKAVLISHDKVTVTRTPPEGKSRLRGAVRRLLGDAGTSEESWRGTADRIGRVIRAHLESDRPAASEAALARMPTTVDLRARVQKILDEEVNPVVAGHGGGVSIFNLIDNVLYVTMEGGCQGCGLADNTLKHGVEAAIRAWVPEVGEIVDVTDHRAGSNPYRGPALKR